MQAWLSARSVSTELPSLEKLIRLTARGFMMPSRASSSMSSRKFTPESMPSKSSCVMCFVGVGSAANSWSSVSGACAGEGPHGASRSTAQRLLWGGMGLGVGMGIGSGHETRVLPGGTRTWWHRR